MIKICKNSTALINYGHLTMVKDHLKSVYQWSNGI